MDRSVKLDSSKHLDVLGKQYFLETLFLELSSSSDRSLGACTLVCRKFSRFAQSKYPMHEKNLS